MKNNKEEYIIIYSICFLLFFVGACTNVENKIDNEVIVVPDSYQGVIVVFYEQNSNKGRIEYRNGKHFFYVDSFGVFFTKLKMGEGVIQTVDQNGKNNYSTEMSINKCNDDEFRVVGGTYRGCKTNLYRHGVDFLNYSVYKADRAKKLKNGNWHVNDLLVLDLYKKALGSNSE